MIWTALKALFAGFIDSVLSAFRRRRQDRELAEGEQRKAENASLKKAQESSKEARKVDEKLENSDASSSDLLGEL